MKKNQNDLPLAMLIITAETPCIENLPSSHRRASIIVHAQSKPTGDRSNDGSGLVEAVQVIQGPPDASHQGPGPWSSSIAFVLVPSFALGFACPR